MRVLGKDRRGLLLLYPRPAAADNSKPINLPIAAPPVDLVPPGRSNKRHRWRIIQEAGAGMSELSDAILLARFRGGDGQALEALFARHEVALFQFLVGMLRDHHQAEDALQET